MEEHYNHKLLTTFDESICMIQTDLNIVSTKTFSDLLILTIGNLNALKQVIKIEWKGLSYLASDLILLFNVYI